MLDEAAKVGIPDKNGSKDELLLEVNWNKAMEGTTNVRVTLGDKSVVVDLKDLFFFVFTAGTQEMQDDLMPVRKTQVYKQIRQHRIVTKRAMKAGEMIIANCEIDIPLSVVDTLKGELFKKKTDMISRNNRKSVGNLFIP